MFYIYGKSKSVKNLIALLILLQTTFNFGQPSSELTVDGFTPVEIPRPNRTNEKLLEMTQAWADNYNRKNPYDVYDVTENSVRIDGFRDNAFFYRSLGESYYHRIKYTIKIDFLEKTCTLNFGVKEIYAKKTLLENSVTAYFNPDGTPKEDMDDVKPSLEATANKILRSYAEFISSNY
jgi:hypothetical protein